MNQVGYILTKIKITLAKRILPRSKSKEIEKQLMTNFLRKNGITIGENCAIFSNICSPESFLISIGNNVSISNDVQLITHDNCIDRMCDDVSDIFGRISIGDNCVIGAKSIIMGGVTIGNNIVVGAGSVVTKSFTEERIIIAGNPARKVSTWDTYIAKNKAIAFHIQGNKKKCILENESKIVKNR